MGTLKKIVRKAKGAVKKIGGSILKPIKSIVKPEKEKYDDPASGTRSEAASRLVNQQKQAGSGQISFNTMEKEEL